jgi:hypothetical protein
MNVGRWLALGLVLALVAGAGLRPAQPELIRQTVSPDSAEGVIELNLLEPETPGGSSSSGSSRARRRGTR